MIISAVQRLARKRSSEALECDSGGGGIVFISSGRSQPWRKVGPVTIADAFDIFNRVLGDLRESDDGKSVRRLCCHLQGGIALHTEFSGIDVPGQVIHGMAQALLSAGKISKVDVAYMSACDKSKGCRSILQCFPLTMKPTHIGADLLDKIPQEVRKEILQIAEHARDLPVDMENLTGHYVISEIMKALDRCGRPSDLQQSCDVHGDQGPCKILQRPGGLDDRRLRLLIAGITCTDYSSAGARRGLLGDSLVPLLVFIWARREGIDDVVLIEEVPAFRKVIMPLLDQFLADIYQVESVFLCPSDIGWPMTRRRCFLRLARRDRVEVSSSFSQHSLRAAFSRTVELRGDDLFMAPQEHLEKLKWRRSGKRARPSRSSDNNADDVWSFLSEGEKARLIDQMLPMQVTVGNSTNDSECTIVNVFRTGKMGSPVRLIPSLTQRTSRIVSLRHMRPLCGLEHLSAMGIAVWPSCMRTNPIANVFEGRSEAELKSFAGNTMNVNVMCAVVAFALGGVALRPYLIE